MADVATSPIELALNLSALDHPVSIALSSEAPAYGQIAANQRPGVEIITVTEDHLGVPEGAPIVLATGPATVSFHANAAKLIAIFPDASVLRAALGEAADLDIEIPARANTHFALLRWDYDASTTTSGTLALSAAASASFSADRGRTGFYALIREIPDGPGALDILNNLVQSLRMPRQVLSLDDIPPGTWIIAETIGSFDAGIAARYGICLNWIQQMAGGTLQGDLGLSVAPAIQVKVGCKASGRYGIILSRGLSGPDQQRIRLQVCEMRGGEFDAALGAGIQVTPSQSGMPQSLDDLLKAILGVHPAQILAAIEKDVPGIENLVHDLAGGQSRLAEWIARWQQLPQQAAAWIWSKLSDQAQIARVADFMARISDLTAADLAAFVQAELSRVTFLSTPEGLLLEALALPGALAALESIREWRQLSARIAALSGILNEAALVGFLQKLKDEIDHRLGVEQIAQAISAADLSKLDQWMVKRLESFFADYQPVTLQKLQNLQEHLRKIANLGGKLYSKTLDAIKRQYSFALTASYQSAGSMTALVDLSLDFSRDASCAEHALALALDGRFDQLLLDSNNSTVLINEAALTRGIRHQGSVELALPFFDRARTHINDALAGINVVDQSDGRILMYSSTASDVVAARNEFESTLAIGLVAPGALGPGVTTHRTPRASCSYSLPMAVKQLTRAHLKALLGAELQEYFPNRFDPDDGSNCADRWLDGLVGAGNHIIGNALLSLDVAFPPEQVVAWMKSPGSRSGVQYKIMSVMLQRKFRRLILQQYFSDMDRYRDVADGSPVFTLLAFASTPCATTAAVNPASSKAEFSSNNGNSIYWDYQDRALRRAVLAHPATVEVLLEHLRAIRGILISAGDSNLAKYYAADQVARMIGSAADSSMIVTLFEVEARIIEEARSAALALAKFQASVFHDPAEARNAIAAFGAKSTTAFHNDLKTYVTGSAMLPFGGLLFAEAARAFDPDLKPASARAMFSLEVLKPGVPFPPAGFPHNAAVSPQDVLIQSRFVNAPG